MKSFICAFVIIVMAQSFIGGAQTAAAQTSTDGIKLEAYPHARAVFSSQLEDDDYILALGSFKKVSGLWEVDRQHRLSGKLSRLTLELPPTHGSKEGFNFYIKQLQQLNARELYRCEGRECGPSNSWANVHFKVIQLYGQDQHQYYAVYEVTQEQNGPAYISLYSVLRGNKRVYVQVDILQTSKTEQQTIASDPDTLVGLLQARSYYEFPGAIKVNQQGQDELAIPEAHLRVLVDVLKQKSSWRMALVGHDYGQGKLDHQQKVSKGYADTLKAALVREGISAARIEAYGIGSLAPAGRGNQSARVEVVRLPD